MNIKTIKKQNHLALRQAKKFRKKANLDAEELHNSIFHSHRNKYPYYGFVEIHNTGCSPFLLYSNHDDLVAQTFLWYGNDSYERESVTQWIKRAKASSTILDIGAYTGLYGLLAYHANPNAEVHAFEPTRRVYSRLLSNIQLNGLYKKMVLVNKALSDKTGSVTFNQYREEHILGTGASFVEKGHQIIDNSEQVETITLDSYVSELDLRVDLVKIDVEEAESRVLEGMDLVLERDGPDILIEVTLQSVDDVVERLNRHSYRIYEINESAGTTTLTNDPKPNISSKEAYGVTYSVNLLAEKH